MLLETGLCMTVTWICIKGQQKLWYPEIQARLSGVRGPDIARSSYCKNDLSALSRPRVIPAAFIASAQGMCDVASHRFYHKDDAVLCRRHKWLRGVRPTL